MTDVSESDFAVVVYREDEAWEADLLPAKLTEDFHGLIQALRQQPPSRVGTFGLVAVGDDFWFFCRFRGLVGRVVRGAPRPWPLRFGLSKWLGTRRWDGVRSSRLWRRMVGVEGKAVVQRVVFDEEAEEVVVWARPFRCDPLRCGRCGTVAAGYDHGEGRRRWRALDAGPVRVFIEADAPRVACPEHGPTVAAVPWARHDARHTVDFDASVAWLVLHCAKSAIATLARIGWRTVGSIVARVMADHDAVAADRLANVRRIGIDEISYQRGHKYLVVVVDHGSGKLLWVGKGRDKKTLAAFFDLLGDERCAKIALVSADGADWIADLVALRCGNARLCMDPFHVVKWVNEALDQVRRRVWRHAQQSGYTALSRELKHARYALVKNPEDLTCRQAVKLARIRDINNPLYRAYLLKEQLRQVFAPGGEERITMLDEWLAWAARCQIPEFVELARKMRRYRGDIANTLVHRLTNGPVEGLNSRIRTIINIAHGFRNTDALMALVRLHLGGYPITLPDRQPVTP